MGAANESERMIFTGDQIAVFSVDKNTKKLISIAVVFTKGRCSGICLSDNAKFFYTTTQKRKLLAKFKVVEKETNAKLAPLSKTETGQLLDCTSIKKARIKPGQKRFEILSEADFFPNLSMKTFFASGSLTSNLLEAILFKVIFFGNSKILLS